MRFSHLALAVVLCATCIPAFSSGAQDPLPAAIAVGSSDASGQIYTTAVGMTLYVTAMDAAGRFGCSATIFRESGRGSGQEAYPLPRAEHRRSCVDEWPPYLASSADRPVARWTIVVRPTGDRQWAYDGSPVYLSRRDRAAGDVNGTMGLARQGSWKVIPVPIRFPPGVRLVQKVDGLMLGIENSRLLFTPGPKAARGGAGSAAWLPMMASELDEPFDDWQIVTRSDGGRQWAYKNQPLYRSDEIAVVQKDVAAGKWKPIVFHKARPRPKFLTMQMSVPELGWVYANSERRTLYAFQCADPTADQLPCDEIGDPAAHWAAVCGTAERCAREWRPVRARPDDRPVGNWGIADVPDPPFIKATDAYGENVPTVRAWTYHGRPVYTFSADTSPGDALGHSIEGTASEFGALTVLGDEFPARP